MRSSWPVPIRFATAGMLTVSTVSGSFDSPETAANAIE